jgi:hypothetical protein
MRVSFGLASPQRAPDQKPRYCRDHQRGLRFLTEGSTESDGDVFQRVLVYPVRRLSSARLGAAQGSIVLQLVANLLEKPRAGTRTVIELRTYRFGVSVVSHFVVHRFLLVRAHRPYLSDQGFHGCKWTGRGMVALTRDLNVL